MADVLQTDSHVCIISIILTHTVCQTLSNKQTLLFGLHHPSFVLEIDLNVNYPVMAIKVIKDDYGNALISGPSMDLHCSIGVMALLLGTTSFWSSFELSFAKSLHAPHSFFGA